MKRLSVAMAATALVLLAGCNNGGDDSDPVSTTGPTPSEPTSSAPSSEAPDAQGVVGDWRDDEADWTLHLAEDGTFTEDFQGNEAVRSGQYRVEGDQLLLEGGDGNTDAGTIAGDTITFNLGTLSRVP